MGPWPDCSLDPPLHEGYSCIQTHDLYNCDACLHNLPKVFSSSSSTCLLLFSTMSPPPLSQNVSSSFSKCLLLFPTMSPLLPRQISSSSSKAVSSSSP